MDAFELQERFPVSPVKLYKSWLSSAGHSAFTGGEATIKSSKGSNFTAWDGYISGKILELEPGRRILQTWRTTEFLDEDEDSLLEIEFEENGSNGTLLTLRHSNIPDGQGSRYKIGWKDFYFNPMKHYFKAD